MEKSVVMLSGGMDSTVAYHWAVRNTEVVKVLFFEFGQRNAFWEAKAVSQMIPKWKYTVRVLNMPPVYPLGAAQKPARNLMLISTAIVMAAMCEADMVVGGWSGVDFDEYPDCRPVFMNALEVAGHLALDRTIRIEAPVIGMSKKEIVELGDRYGVDWTKTRSCYTAQEKPCGECAACKHRREALEYHGHSFS